MAGFLQIDEYELADRFPLHFACKEGDVQRVTNLLENDKNLAVLEDAYFGWTPAHWAAYYGKLDCLKSIMSVLVHGINLQTSKGCITPVHSAAEGGRPSCLIWLLYAGANVNIKDFSGETPLHKCARTGNAECVTLLIASSCDIRTLNNFGETPGVIAERNGHQNVAAFILQAEFVRELGGSAFRDTLGHAQPCRKRTIDAVNCNGFAKRMRVETPDPEPVEMNYPMIDMSTSVTPLPALTSSAIEHEKLCRMEQGYRNAIFECFLSQFHGF